MVILFHNITALLSWA